jgi:lysophospholipase L1-like esterase
MATALMTLPSWSQINGQIQGMPSGAVYNCSPGGQIAANLADVKTLTAIGFVPVTNGVFSKIRRLAKTAWNNNPHSLGVMPSGTSPGDAPTIIVAAAFPPSGFASSGAGFSSVGLPPNLVLPGYPSMFGSARLFGGYPSGEWNAVIQVADVAQSPASAATTFTGIVATPKSIALDGFQYRVEINADAAKVAIGIAGNDGGLWRFLVNDQYVSLNGQAINASGNQSFILDFTSVGGRAIRKIAVEGERYDSFIGFAVQPTETLFPTRADDLLRMIVLGDSYTAGFSIANNTYGDSCFRVMGDYLGIRDIWTSGAPGTGYLQTTSTCTYTLRQRLSDATSHNPDIIGFCMGQNDAGVFTPAQIQAEALAAMEAFRSTLPNTPLAVFGTFGENSGPSATMVAAEQAVQAAFNQSGDSNSIFIPLCTAASPILTGTGTVGAPTGSGNCDVYIVSGDVHPNAAGHIYMGKWLASAFLTASAGKM